MCFQNVTRVIILHLYWDYTQTNYICTSIDWSTFHTLIFSIISQTFVTVYYCLLSEIAMEGCHVFHCTPCKIFCLKKSLHYVPLSLFSDIHNIVSCWIETCFFLSLFAVGSKCNLQYLDFHYTLDTLLPLMQLYYSYVTFCKNYQLLLPLP